ncbi:Apoptosis-inducing factor 2 [Mycena venus]|uniref:Apoptosis-inducing factor 2 n=1 Tax=Mycena venus TaxID=2733690 RepID=A0A8H6XBF5_9AGAR|nr:Apoptosis-inducing factor 2 [Mycena venus]
MGEKLKVAWVYLRFVGPYLGRLLFLSFSAFHQRWTYKLTPDAKNVVVIGGSFAGIELVKGLAATLPTGFKLIWIEKNSHLNFSFTFPAVLRGPGLRAHRLHPDTVVDYEYLVIATGSSQPLPVQVASTELRAACKELQSVQEAINASQKIAIVGAGADFNPEKDVTLIHSRGQILNTFGKRLHDHTLPIIQDELKVRVLLNERPQLPKDRALLKNKTLTFSDGHEESFDLVIACTGQRPNSSFLASLLPDAISKETSRILSPLSPNPRIFAFGDVAEHGGPKMARAGLVQSITVLDNILALIHRRSPSAPYTYAPQLVIEGPIKLTLGGSRLVIYAQHDPEGTEDMLMSVKNNKVDLDIARAWRMFGVDFKRAKGQAGRKELHLQAEPHSMAVN